MSGDGYDSCLLFCQPCEKCGQHVPKRRDVPLCEGCGYRNRPAAPVVQGADELREAIDRYIVELREVLARQLWEQEERPEDWWDDEEEREAYRAPIDAVLALPELRQLLADAAAGRRVREVMAEWDRGMPLGGYLPLIVGRALDGGA